VAFPLAHPAAVLPLRRWCPSRLNFAALVIGSLTPDISNFLDWDHFTHSFRGSFEFGLPAGIVLLLIFYRVRRPLVEMLPNPHREALLPLCIGRENSFFVWAVSLLVGNWSHQGWDFFTHGDSRMIQEWGSVTMPFHVGGSNELKVSGILYLLSTAGGLVALTLTYLSFLKRSGKPLFGAPIEWRRYGLWVGILSIPAVPALILTSYVYGFRSYSVSWLIRQFAEYYYASLFLTLALAGVRIGRGISHDPP
jgi:hypothetical protein